MRTQISNQEILFIKQYCANPENSRQAKIALLHTYDNMYANGKQATILLQIIAELRAFNDFGAWGKTYEAQLRIYRICVVLGKLIKIKDLWARSAEKRDLIIRHGDITYYIECKTCTFDSDFMTTLYSNIDQELTRIENLQRILIWATREFTIVLPYAEFIQALEKYGAPLTTFIHMNKDCTKTRLQCWCTSKAKTDFLKYVAKNSYNLKVLLDKGELVRR